MKAVGHVLRNHQTQSSGHSLHTSARTPNAGRDAGRRGTRQHGSRRAGLPAPDGRAQGISRKEGQVLAEKPGRRRDAEPSSARRRQDRRPRMQTNLRPVRTRLPLPPRHQREGRVHSSRLADGSGTSAPPPALAKLPLQKCQEGKSFARDGSRPRAKQAPGRTTALRKMPRDAPAPAQDRGGRDHRHRTPRERTAPALRLDADGFGSLSGSSA